MQCNGFSTVVSTLILIKQEIWANAHETHESLEQLRFTQS